MREILLSLLLPVILFSCAGTPDIHSPAETLSVQEIVALYPADDSQHQILLNRSLLDRGSKGISIVCVLLCDTAEAVRTRAEYALAGVVSSAPPADYPVIETGLLPVLASDIAPEQKIFLLEQLRICATDRSLQLLARLMTSPRLAEPAIQTLQAIGTEKAAELMHRMLPVVSADSKLSLVNLLGMDGYQKAAEDIYKMVGDESLPLRYAAMQALANLGYVPAEGLLYANMQDPGGMPKAAAAAIYLCFLENARDDSLVVNRCRAIYRNPLTGGNIRIHAAEVMLSRMYPDICG